MIVPNHRWDATYLLDILENNAYKYLPADCKEWLDIAKGKGLYIFFLLGIPINGRREFCLIRLRSLILENDLILRKIKRNPQLDIYPCNRLDYEYLSMCIGNDVSLTGKKALVIGAGSLGSYLCEEITKAGIKDLAIFDPDILAKENTFRWSSPVRSGYYVSKAVYLKMLLERVNPEIFVEAFDKEMTQDELTATCNQFDIIFIAVGSSDFQFMANKALKESHYQGWVIFVWLEAGGVFSHILCVNYNFPGCYQCLFTRGNGEITSNRYENKFDETNLKDIFIDNACGGTRAVYGNAILLRTVAALLVCIKRLFSGKLKSNILLNISPNEIIDEGDDFAQGKCRCCGDKSAQ